MKKRMMTWLLVLLAALTLTVPSFAEQTEDDLLIYDAAELLNEDEWLELELLADEITWRYNCAVYIVTIPDYEDYGDSPYNAAANIYNTQDFGIGEERSGVLLMLSTWELCPVYPRWLRQEHDRQVRPVTAGRRIPRQLCQR